MANFIQDDILKVNAETSGLSSIDLKAFKYSIGEREKIIIASERHINDIIEELDRKRNKKERDERIKALDAEIKAREEAIKKMEGAEASSAKRENNRKKKQLEEMQEEELKLKKQTAERAAQIEDTYQKNYYKNLDVAEKKAYDERRLRLLEQTRDQEEQNKQIELAMAPIEKRAEIIAEYAEKEALNRKESAEAVKRIEKSEKALNEGRLKAQKALGTASLADRKREEADRKRKEADEAADRLAAAYASGDEQKIAQAEEEAKRKKKEADEAGFIAGLVKSLSNAIANTLRTAINAVDSGIEFIKSFQSPMMARLQGYSRGYGDILGTLSGNIAMSPYVSYKKTLDNLSKLVESGIAYNVEERAFLATISDKIATTFNAFDSNLMRIIRLQQADTTASRLAMESYLTKFLNSMFSDTSYLSDVYDTVQGAILDASSQLSYKDSTAFEYVLQKWLGSLYSLGLSDAAVTSIAGGINMLATGNVQGLSGNSPLQTLLAMSASRSPDVDYAEALLNGLDSSQLNSLMKSMVEYLKEIATNSDSRVVKAAYGDIFDMSLSDLAAIQNLTNQDINNIAKSMLPYDASMRELYTQFTQVSSRTSMSEQISNVFENLSFAQAQGIADSSVLYPMWLVTNLITQATGGIPLPNIGWFGNFLDLTAFHVEDFVKLGIIGASTLGMIGDIVNSLGSAGGLAGDIFGAWNATQTTSRGQGVSLTSPVGMGTSLSARATASGASSDIKQAGLQQQVEEANEMAETTMPDADKNKTINDLYEALFEEGQQQEILVRNKNFDKFAEALLPGVTKDAESMPAFMSNSVLPTIFGLETESDEAGGRSINVHITGADVALGGGFGGGAGGNSITAEQLSALLSFESEGNRYSFGDLIRKLMEENVNVQVQNDTINTFFDNNQFARIEQFGGL